MAENTNLKYEQINWGWLNDYSGYKFAPITFFDNLYTEDGKSFKNEYNTTLEKLRNGEFLVGRAQALAIPNADGSSTLFETDSVKPVYFHEGKPTVCESIVINVTGNLTGDVTGDVNNDANYGDKTVKAGTLVSTTANMTTLTTSGLLTADGGISVTSIRASETIFAEGTITTTSEVSAASVHGGTITGDSSIYTPELKSTGDTLYLRVSDNSGLRITSNAIHSMSSSGTFGKESGAKIYGAVWNDYAEFRDQYEDIEPGYCVCSSDSGKVFKTMEKLSPCDGIVSDTYGFAIGDTDECRTPLAVAGRVLAYCEGDRMDYHAGDTVCASANGKVCKMTREEIREYPDRIVGVVSEIPQYEIWNNGIEVKGRIWVNIK